MDALDPHAAGPVRARGERLDQLGAVTGFREKPRAEHWINGGFFLCEPGFIAHLGPDLVLEREPLEELATAGGLHAYRHLSLIHI